MFKMSLMRNPMTSSKTFMNSPFSKKTIFSTKLQTSQLKITRSMKQQSSNCRSPPPNSQSFCLLSYPLKNAYNLPKP
jgi:hypothetical protein